MTHPLSQRQMQLSASTGAESPDVGLAKVENLLGKFATITKGEQIKVTTNKATFERNFFIESPLPQTTRLSALN